MTQRGRAPTASSPASTLDAMNAQLDSAMADTITEIQQQGGDVTPESVVRGPDGRFQPTRQDPDRTSQRPRRQRPSEPRTAQEDAGDDLTYQTLVDDDQDETSSTAPTREPQRRSRREEAPDEDDEDTDDEEDEEEESSVEVEDLSDELEAEDDGFATEEDDPELRVP